MANERANVGLYLHSAYWETSQVSQRTWKGTVYGLASSKRPPVLAWRLQLVPELYSFRFVGAFFVGVLGFELNREKGIKLLKKASKGLSLHGRGKDVFDNQGLIAGSQDFLADKDEALKGAFQRMQATCNTFGKAPMFHWMTSQLARVSGNIELAIKEVKLAKEGFADFEADYELFRIKKEIAWCHYIKGGDWEIVASATEGPAQKTTISCEHGRAHYLVVRMEC